MRLIKMLGLSAIGALVAMAFVGAGSASAVTLCEANESPCTHKYPSGTVIKTKLAAGTTAILKGEPIGTVECSVSTGEGKTTAESASPLPGEITSLSFTSCTLAGTACTVTVEHLPFFASLTSSGGGNGTLTAKSSGAGRPQALVKCGSLLKCIFGANEVSLKAEGGNPGFLKAEGIELEREGGIGFVCPNEAKWTAKYEVEAPKPVFVSALP